MCVCVWGGERHHVSTCVYLCAIGKRQGRRVGWGDGGGGRGGGGGDG